MNAGVQYTVKWVTPVHRKLGPELNAPHSYSREFLSLRFHRLAEEYEQLAAEATAQGRARTFLRQQAALARQHAVDVRTNVTPRVVYVSRVSDKRYVFWRADTGPLCDLVPWGIADVRAKRWIESENVTGAGLYPRPIRFDPPEAP